MLDIDQPKDARDVDAIDVESLVAFLGDRCDLTSPIGVRQFLSGYSNLTFELFGADDSKSLLVRRPPYGAKEIKSGHDMSREYRVLEALKPTFGKVPTPIAYCDDESVIGASFYVMERVRGAILRGTEVPEAMDAQRMAETCRGLIQTLVEIHDVDVEHSGLSDFGRPEGYVERQVTGWAKRYTAAKTDDIDDMDFVSKWLAENLPKSFNKPTLVHNDFKYDNVMVDPEDPSKIIAVLDWEMSTVGEPLTDLGTTLAYWVEPQDDPLLQTVAGPTAAPGNLDRAEVAKYYGELSGRDISDVVFYFALGCFKVAVIGQQIYARFKKGQSKDPRFGGLIFLVHAMAKRAKAAIETGNLS